MDGAKDETFVDQRLAQGSPSPPCECQHCQIASKNLSKRGDGLRLGWDWAGVGLRWARPGHASPTPHSPQKSPIGKLDLRHHSRAHGLSIRSAIVPTSRPESLRYFESSRCIPSQLTDFEVNGYAVTLPAYSTLGPIWPLYPLTAYNI